VAKKRSQENTKQKQDFVAQMVQKDKAASMYKIGLAVKDKFGTVLSYDKLREAFTGAGGKVEDRKGGPKGGSKKGSKPGPKPKAAKAKPGPKPKAAKAAAKGGKRRGRGTAETTVAKQEFVKQYVAGNPGVTMNQVGTAVTAKFGTQLGFNKLKEAFKAAGGKVGKPGRQPKDRAKVQQRKAGRRSSDVAAARTASVLKEMPGHVVVTNLNKAVETTQFSTKEQAVAFARKQLMAGIPASKIAYYTREPLQISLGI
jgi:hypothetical protein